MTQTSILIVDESAPVRRMMRSLFADRVTVYECDDGAKAAQCYAAQQPDWVLMDLTLNGMDGLTVMRQILAQWPQARVVIVDLATRTVAGYLAAGETPDGIGYTTRVFGRE